MSSGEHKRIILGKLEAEFKKRDKNNTWMSLFTKLSNESAKSKFPFKIGGDDTCKNLNRYRDVIPYDYTRVILQKPGFSYINASHIDINGVQQRYILTQGPLVNTIHHFWLMIWEQNCKAVVMLNNLIENHQVKCVCYWPHEDNPEIVMPDVCLKINFASRNQRSDYVIFNYCLTNTETEETRSVAHFHFTDWPDYGVPRNPAVFMKFLRAVRQYCEIESDAGPLVVHCSAGIGRSGTFCLVDVFLQLINRPENANITINEMLLELRKYRFGLVQTAEQLRFSFLSIIQGLKMNWDSEDDSIPRGDELNYLQNPAHAMLAKRLRPISESDEDDPPVPPQRYESIEYDRPLPCLPVGYEQTTSTNGAGVESDKESESAESDTRISENGSEPDHKLTESQESDSNDVERGPESDTKDAKFAGSENGIDESGKESDIKTETGGEEHSISTEALKKSDLDTKSEGTSKMRKRIAENKEKSKRVSEKINEMKKKRAEDAGGRQKWFYIKVIGLAFAFFVGLMFFKLDLHSYFSD